jgi:hypothetical protein
MEGIKFGNRYTFYEKNTTYRGKLLETRIIPSGLKYRPNIQYIYVLCDDTVRIIDTIQIVKIENLSQILGGKTQLNDDVLSVIDEFL